MSYILTHTGRKFYPMQPHFLDVDIVDIAHALSQQCRFTGHTKEFFSVAQHSISVACQFHWGRDPLLALVGLLHDAPEAYLADVSTPVKHALTNYEDIEAGLWRAIAERFDLPAHWLHFVKHADLVALATERRDLMPYHHEEWPILRGVVPVPWPIRPLPPTEAKELFLDTFDILTSFVRR